ncbi:MAG: tRNA pseudouridine(38-40) synthase TruA [Candidatus Thorarchaeota archaeon]
MVSYLSRLFYLGDNYYGSQYQPGLTTVQGELIDALSDWSGEHHSTQTVQISGRTDRGVHSIGQLVMVSTEKQFNIDKINRYLPDDIILWAFTVAPSNFVPRYDVLMRHYRYYLDQSWSQVNLTSVKKAVSLLVGSNDFNQLAKPDGDRNTVTTILNISIHEFNGSYFLDIFGTRFLWKLIRKMITLLTEIGKERIRLDAINDILSGKRVLASGVQPAPPENLVLMESVVPIRMTTSKNAVRLIRTMLADQLGRYRRAITTIENVSGFFSEPKMTFQHSTKQQNHSDSLDLS